MTITSPCTGICKLDTITGWCLGCGRSGDEIATWATLPGPLRDDVWARVPGRLDQMGVTCRRLPWTNEQIRAFVTSRLSEGRGTWIMGVVGAVAEFSCPPGAVTDVSWRGEIMTAQTRDGAMRMTINDDVRAVTFDPPGLGTAPRIVLAVKRERGRLPVTSTIQGLGEDRAALTTAAGTRLFDLGLGRKEARFGVRVAAGPSRAALERAVGKSLTEALPRIGPSLIVENPTRVVESILGRIEVTGPIRAAGGVSPPGPHTHLLPDQLATGRALPAGMELPRAYLPGALFYPSN